MIRPTARLVVLVGAAAPIGAMLILLEETLWVAPIGYLAGLAFLVMFDRLAGLHERGLSLSVEPPSALYIGEIGRLVIVANAPTGRQSIVVEAVLEVDEKLRTPPPFELEIDEAGAGRIEIDLEAHRRGDGRLETLHARWRSPFGLAWRVATMELDRTVPVLPNLPSVKRAAMMLTRRAAVYGAKPQLHQGDGVEFDALREHMPGMELRTVDWKHSARHNKLLCKEFKAERNHNIVLAFDAGQLMREPIDGVPKLDHAINAGLVLAFQALVEGDNVGVYSFGAQPGAFRAPVSGPTAFQSVLEGVTSLEYFAEETNFTLGLGRLLAQLKRRSVVILLTDILDTVSAELMVRNLAHLTRRHMLVFAALRDPATLSDLTRAPEDDADLARIVVSMELEDERAAVIRRLRRLGADPLDVPPAGLTTALLNRYFRLKRQTEIEQV